MAFDRKYTLDNAGPPAIMLGAPARRIRALRDIPEHGVRAGDLGGLIQSEDNLSQRDASWISCHAAAIGQSRVEGDALARGYATLTDYAVATDRAVLSGYARARGHAMIEGSAQLSDMACAEGRVVLGGTLSASGALALIGDETYLDDGDLPYSLSGLKNTDPRYAERLIEAMDMDPAFHMFMQRAYSASTQAKRVQMLLWCMDDPHARLGALWSATSILGGTFYRATYQRRSGRDVTAEQALAVHRLKSSLRLCNARVLCCIGSSPISSFDRSFYMGVAMVMMARRSKPLFQPLVLQDQFDGGSLNPLPFQIEAVPEFYESLPDAEERSAQIAAQRACKGHQTYSPAPGGQVAANVETMPLVLDARACDSDVCLVVQFDTRDRRTYAELRVGDDFGGYLDLADTLPRSMAGHLHRLDAAMAPVHPQLHLPTPNPQLAELLARAANTPPDQGQTIMKRDMDLIRTILLEIEEDANINGRFIVSDADLRQDNTDAPTIQYHLRLLMDAGYIEGHDAHKLTGEIILPKPEAGLPRREDMPAIQITRMTWEGHDFLESVRDDKVWQKTKGYLKDIGGVGIDVLKDVAKAVVKDQIKQYTGMSLG